MPVQYVALEERGQRLALGVQLTDACSDTRNLRGRVSVALAGHGYVPLERTSDGTFLFFAFDPASRSSQPSADIPPGNYVVEVRCELYLPVDIAINVPLPNPLWPVFPDVTLADPSLPLHDLGQPAVWKAQRNAARLVPNAHYPFPAGTTLVRGTVLSAGAPLADARVTSFGTTGYVTGADGEFALSFPEIGGSGATVTLLVTHALHLPQSKVVDAVRGMTVATEIDMP